MFVTFTKQPDTFEQAVDAHRSGRLSEAEQVYRRILTENPQHADALHMLGLLAHQSRNSQMASQLIERSIVLNPRNATAYSNLAEVKRTEGKLAEAEALCRKALEIDPRLSAAYVNMAMSVYQQGRAQEALQHGLQAIDLGPREPAGYTVTGLCLAEMGRLQDSVRYLEESIKLNPNDANITSTLGLIYSRLEENQKAQTLMTRAVALAPDNPQILLNMGAMLATMEKFAEAAEWLEKCLQLQPGFTAAMEHLAGVRTGLKQFEESIAMGYRILEANPNSIDTYATIGEAMMNLGRFDECISEMNKALAIRETAAVRQTISNAYTRSGQPERGLVEIERALQLDPRNAILHFNRSVILMLCGRLQEAWGEYEWRWQHPRMVGRNRRFSVPQWNGEPLNGKRILLHAEQGMGDTIFFGRYAMLVSELKGGKCVMWVQNSVADLVKTIPGVVEVVPEQGPLPQVDCHLPIMSLPRVFNTSLETIPCRFPYIKTNPEKSAYWKKELAARTGKFKVGLVWYGGDFQPENFLRSASLAAYAPLGEVPNVTFFGLQKGPAEVQSKNPPPGMDFQDLGPYIQDFSDTAAILENLDLLISIDTSVVHVNCALNKPVWMLLAWSPGHMWMFNRDDSPWYPMMRIFRQPAFKDWVTPVARVKAELNKLVNGG